MQLSPFPSGWALGFLIQENEDAMQIGFLAIVGMEIGEGNRIHAIVAAPTGELKRDHDVEHPMICIAGPDDDRERVGKAGLAEWMRKQTTPPRGPGAQA